MKVNYEKRYSLIIEEVYRRKFDAFLVTQSGNLRYLTSPQIPFFPIVKYIVLPRKREPIVFFHKLEVNRVRDMCPISDQRMLPDVVDEDKWKSALKKNLSRLGLEKILCDGKMEFEGFIFEKSDFVNDLRSRKDDYEINLIMKSAKIASKAVKFLEDNVLAEGVTEMEVANEVDHYMRSIGAQATSFHTIVASGLNSSYPHHHPTMKKLRKGETVICDLGAVYEGYCSDLTRTFLLGNPSSKLTEIYDAVYEAQMEAIKAVKANTEARSIELAAREVLSSYGLEKYFIHSIGHGIGLEIHEKPIISKDSEEAIRDGNVFTVEPGVYVKGVGGVRIEDDLIVKGGVKVLTGH